MDDLKEMLADIRAVSEQGLADEHTLILSRQTIPILAEILGKVIYDCEQIIVYTESSDNEVKFRKGISTQAKATLEVIEHEWRKIDA